MVIMLSSSNDKIRSIVVLSPENANYHLIRDVKGRWQRSLFGWVTAGSCVVLLVELIERN
jgi:hypothetical protein